MIADHIYSLAPGLACIIMVGWLWMSLWKRDQKAPFFDVGVFCALATLVYTVYPLLNYWVDGMQFGPFSDRRLQAYNIRPAELGFFHLRHVVYLFSFVSAYLAFRGRGTIGVGNIGAPSRSAQRIIIVIFLSLTVYFFLLQWLTGANYNASYEAETYSANIAAFASLPLFVLQISTKLAGILFLFKLALLMMVISRCKKKWLAILLVWIAAEIIQTFLIKGSRTGLILFLFACALFQHRMIKPLKMKFLLASGIVVLVGFIFLGMYRSYFDITEMRLDLALANAGMFSGNNEFQALLGTAYDVKQLKDAGAHLPWYLYINDFIKILPPQQLLPFEKVPASEWYLREIGLSGTGLGLMWGVITQSIVGLDWLELPMRGALLGYILARFHRWYVTRQTSFLATLIYVYFCLRIYYTFRDTTFSLLADLVWVVVPFYCLLRIGKQSLRLDPRPWFSRTMPPQRRS